MRRLGLTLLIAIAVHFAGAATLTTRDGQIFQGDVQSVHDAAGHEKLAVVPQGDGFTLQFPLADVANIAYRPPISGVLSGGTLPGGWSVRDVGDVGLAGSANYNQGVFSLSGEGSPPDWHSDSFHFVYQRIAQEGELIVRLNTLSVSDTKGFAGLMIRQSADAESRFAMIDISAAGQSEFRSKPNPTAAIVVQKGSKTKLPCWLRLRIYRDVVTASQSADGKKWEWVGREVLPGIHDACIGMVVTSQKSDELATASFDRVLLKINGLRGDYFAGIQFNDLRVTRIDPAIDFNWGASAPDVKIPVSGYTARWTGQIEAPSSDIYTFQLTASEWAKLWINGQPIYDTRSRILQSGKVKLEAQQRYDIRVDFGKDIHSGVCQLLWAIGDQAQEVIPTDAFIYHRQVDEIPEATPLTRFVPLARGTLLVDGSFLPGSVASITGETVQFRYRNRSAMDIPLRQVARVIFEPLASGLAAKMSDKPGMLTRQGDFIEGECQSLDQDHLKLSSVVFGSTTYDITTQVAALVLRAPSPAPSAWIIHTTSGAVFRTNGFQVDGANATLSEQVLDRFLIPSAELIDISSSMGR